MIFKVTVTKSVSLWLVTQQWMEAIVTKSVSLRLYHSNKQKQQVFESPSVNNFPTTWNTYLYRRNLEIVMVTTGHGKLKLSSPHYQQTISDHQDITWSLCDGGSIWKRGHLVSGAAWESTERLSDTGFELPPHMVTGVQGAYTCDMSGENGFKCSHAYCEYIGTTWRGSPRIIASALFIQQLWQYKEISDDKFERCLHAIMQNKYRQNCKYILPRMLLQSYITSTLCDKKYTLVWI